MPARALPVEFLDRDWFVDVYLAFDPDEALDKALAGLQLFVQKKLSVARRPKKSRKLDTGCEAVSASMLLQRRPAPMKGDGQP